MRVAPLKPRFNSVRGRLFLLIAVLVVPAMGIAAVLAWRANRDQQAAVRTELSNTARAVAGLVDAEVDRSVAMLQLFTASPSLLNRNWVALDAMARRAITSENRWFVLVDLDTGPLINTRVPAGQPIPPVEFDPEYVTAMREGRVFISNLVYGPAARRNVVHVGIPYVDERGRVYGLNIVMEPQTLGTVFNVQRYAPEGVIVVLDRNGRIISRSRNQDEFIGGYATPDIVKVTREQFEGVGESVTLEKIDVLTAFTHAKCGWAIAIGTPKAPVLAAARRLFLIGMAATLIAAVLATAVAASIARAVLSGVDELARHAERLAAGESSQFPARHLEEIGTIADAMRRLAHTKSEAQEQLREARDRLQQYAFVLEEKVAERTGSLREALAQMEEFTYTVSHDLRAPLRAIHGYATILLEDHHTQLDPGAKEYVQRIVRASDRMHRMTSDVLSYSRVAKADVRPNRVALEPLLRVTLDQYAELQPPAAEVTLVKPLDDVIAHETSLAQALTNLLTNAAKFVRPGERPKITVRTERRGDRVRVWIEDNGIGIPRSDQERLFRIFERAPAAQAYDGTGVGLAIVRKVIERSGGACGVESDGVNGSRFWIELVAA